MPNQNHRVESVLEALKKDFIVVGKTRVHSWHAWLSIGLAVGVTAGILFVANRSGELEAGMAALLSPIGNFEDITATGLAYGWTLDPDAPSQSIDVHFYIDGQVGQGGRFAGSVSANLSSPDVNSIGYPGNHRFSFVIPNEFRDGHLHSFYAYAIDPAGGSNPLLGGSLKTFTISNKIPVGNVESISSGGVVSGWALDIDSQSQPIIVHFYLDKQVDQGGVFIGSATASQSRADVNSATGYAGNHGFKFVIPNTYSDGKEHKIYAYAIDSSGGHNPLIPSSPISNKIVYTWDPFIKKECYSTYITPVTGTDCSSITPIKHWIFGSTNEDENFTGGTLNDFLTDSPIWKYAFNRKKDGSYQIGWVIDKASFDLYRNRYSFAGFTDSWNSNVNPISAPTLNQDIRSVLRINLMEQEQLNDGINGLAKNRVMLGTVANWNNRNHFLEVNLWKTSNFDLCTGACDISNFYDRRVSLSNVEVAYFDGTKLYEAIGVNEPVLNPNGGFKEFDIPWTKLYRNYPWNDPPSSWTNIKLKGVYIGIEVWGKGRVWTEFDNYQTYSLVP